MESNPNTIKISVNNKEYDCYWAQQPDKLYSAYGTFENMPIKERGASLSEAINKLKESVAVRLD